MNAYLDRLIRADRDIITAIIPENARVLDLGCGDGALLAELRAKKNVIGHGVDFDDELLIRSMERGLTVSMGDLDAGLADHPDGSYDYVILNQTLQVVTRPDQVIREMLRIGRHAIVGVPNFAYLPHRLMLLFSGRMPVSAAMPFQWYDTPNIHPLTISDFRQFCRERHIDILREEYLLLGKWRHATLINPLANLLAVTGMFVLAGACER